MSPPLVYLLLLIHTFTLTHALTVSFTRRFDTCDTQDQIITDGTTKLVYAYSSRNPSTNNGIPTYHEAMGTRSVRLVDAKPVEPIMPADAHHLDLTTRDTTIPFPAHDPTTSYYCNLFAINTTSRAHIVRWEPLFDPPQNNQYVHHILVYECQTALPTDVGHNQLCDELPERLGRCLSTNVVSAWAVGGETFNYPNNIGYPIGTDDTTRYVLMQTHYNNPQRISPIIDSSGMRYTITTQHLRPIEAGTLFQGYNTDGRFTIPARTQNTLYAAPCTSECTRQLFQQPVKLIASLLHMHTTGVAIKTRHIRDGVELPNIMSERYYDFNFQDFEYQSKEIDFYPGDELLTECHYDTSLRPNITTFGESTQQEMCISFHIYYPRIIHTPAICVYGDYRHIKDVSEPYNTTMLLCGNTTHLDIAPINITTPLPIPTCTHHTPDDIIPVLRDIIHFNTSSYQHQLYLDDAEKVSMWWSMDEVQQVIHVAMDVDVDGWMGLGFSPTGGMINADVITSWMDKRVNTTDNSTNYIMHVEDRFATAHATPPMDTYQDITNIVFYVDLNGEPTIPSSSSSTLSTEAIIAIAASSGLALLVLLACILRYMRHRRTTSSVSHRLLVDDKHTYGK